MADCQGYGYGYGECCDCEAKGILMWEYANFWGVPFLNSARLMAKAHPDRKVTLVRSKVRNYANGYLGVFNPSYEGGEFSLTPEEENIEQIEYEDFDPETIGEYTHIIMPLYSSHQAILSPGGPFAGFMETDLHPVLPPPFDMNEWLASGCKRLFITGSNPRFQTNANFYSGPFTLVENNVGYRAQEVYNNIYVNTVMEELGVGLRIPIFGRHGEAIVNESYPVNNSIQAYNVYWQKETSVKQGTSYQYYPGHWIGNRVIGAGYVTHGAIGQGGTVGGTFYPDPNSGFIVGMVEPKGNSEVVLFGSAHRWAIPTYHRPEYKEGQPYVRVPVDISTQQSWHDPEGLYKAYFHMHEQVSVVKKGALKQGCASCKSAKREIELVIGPASGDPGYGCTSCTDIGGKIIKIRKSSSQQDSPTLCAWEQRHFHYPFFGCLPEGTRFRVTRAKQPDVNGVRKDWVSVDIRMTPPSGHSAVFLSYTKTFDNLPCTGVEVTLDNPNPPSAVWCTFPPYVKVRF